MPLFEVESWQSFGGTQVDSVPTAIRYVPLSDSFIILASEFILSADDVISNPVVR
jgi:hypothetical protein